MFFTKSWSHELSIPRFWRDHSKNWKLLWDHLREQVALGTADPYYEMQADEYHDSDLSCSSLCSCSGTVTKTQVLQASSHFLFSPFFIFKEYFRYSENLLIASISRTPKLAFLFFSKLRLLLNPSFLYKQSCLYIKFNYATFLLISKCPEDYILRSYLSFKVTPQMSPENIVTSLFLPFSFVLFSFLQAYKPAIVIGATSQVRIGSQRDYTAACVSSMQTNFSWSRQPC